jgi:hypothetical protein
VENIAIQTGRAQKTDEIPFCEPGACLEANRSWLFFVPYFQLVGQSHIPAALALPNPFLRVSGLDSVLSERMISSDGTS